MHFTADINIHSEDGSDMTLDYPKPGIYSLKQHLLQENFIVLNESIAIAGTKNISDLIELTIQGNDFIALRESIVKFLNDKNVSFNEEQLYVTGDLHSRFNLEDISIFDRIKKS